MRNLKGFSCSMTCLVALVFVLIAAFLRLWNLPNSLQFLGDQGRDALIVSRIFKEADLVFIGPTTSVGNMYLGPLYYYFMLPFLFISYPSPLGPAYAVAVLGIITVWLTYYLGKELIGEKPALVAAALMSISSTVVLFSRFSWNPNPEPFVTIILIYFTYLAWKKNILYWLVVAICFSVLIQLHYVTLLSAGGFGLIWLLQAIELVKKSGVFSKKSIKLWGATLGAALIVLVSLTPLVLFDAKHDWLNVKAFNKLLVVENSFKGNDFTLPSKVLKAVKETHGRSMHILFEITVGNQRTVNTLLVVGVIGTLLYLIKEKTKNHPGDLILASFLFTGIIGLSFYEHSVFDHYIAYLFPITFLVLGRVLVYWWQKNMITKALVLAFTIYFLNFNFMTMPLGDAGWKISDIKRTADTIAERVEPGEKYNIVLLSETGDIDAQNYRYYLETTDKPPVRTEQRGEIETLFIINEDRKLEKVTDSPIYEIVVFHDKEPKEVYTISGGPEITVLRKEK